MKRTLANPVFLICLVLAILNQIIEKGFGVFIPLVHSYLDDVLCFPIVLTLGLSMYRYFKPRYKLGLWHMLSALLLHAIYFEWYLPKTSIAYTADFVDVIMYSVGLVVFSYFINDEDDIGLVTHI